MKGSSRVNGEPDKDAFWGEDRKRVIITLKGGEDRKKLVYD